MTATVKQLARQVLALPVDDRASLAQKVCDSIEHFSNHETEKAWMEEADRRWREIEEGKVVCIPAEDVMRRARASLGNRA